MRDASPGLGPNIPSRTDGVVGGPMFFGRAGFRMASCYLEFSKGSVLILQRILLSTLANAPGFGILFDQSSPATVALFAVFRSFGAKIAKECDGWGPAPMRSLMRAPAADSDPACEMWARVANRKIQRWPLPAFPRIVLRVKVYPPYPKWGVHRNV
jgi:hypothetical protein